jgi:transposase
MLFVPQIPKKVQFIFNFSFPVVRKLCKKTALEQFVGGRKGYDKEFLFMLLLMKKVTNWDYRTIASMGKVCHSTLVRANSFFLKRGIYEKVFTHLIRQAFKQRLIKGKYVAMDSSFVHTFSKHGELGSEGWNEFKKAYGFKLHVLVDCETKFPIAVCITNGLASDNTLAIPLLKKAKSYLKKAGYILADKGYDDTSLVNWIIKELSRKSAIPMRKKSKLAKGKKHRYGNLLNWQIKAIGRIFRKSIYNRRSAVERTFSMLKRKFHLGKEETRGILAFAKNVYLSLICYMLSLFNIAKIS